MVLSKQPSIVGFVNWIGEIPFLIEHVLAQDIMFYPLLNEFSIFPQIKKKFQEIENFSSDKYYITKIFNVYFNCFNHLS